MKAEDVKTIKDAAAYFLKEHGDVFSEAYHVAGAIEVVANGRLFKIEPKESLCRVQRVFDVRVYEMKEEKWEVWTDFPYCDRASPETVMMQALSFMWDRLRKS